ncbi:HET-domain-containing protein [Lophiostoma macrostomum CBS 122681]|uniref:HET-domain-containing protein n=1 Tax=Lophiostoma macrostomum CBS 122681 TaxID=1314788 RepID=A0A6A6SLW0_9PLEO|nr:HET-domain-containing protein [Lophiostoma macrostomum CBS 122681]
MSDPHLHKSSLYTSIPTNSGRWIRLLLLLQGTPSDPITCLLQPFDLDTLERCDDDKKLSPYAALSYVWGSRASPREITCNGQPLKVTRNLFDALVAIRHPTTAGPLWVDAICINQEDVEERNHQVGLMASVYRQARRVFIWLGHGDREFVEPAFTYICQRANHVYAQVRWIVQDAEARRASYVTRGEEVDGSKLHLEDPRPTAAQYSAFATFLRQPWFFRLWIVQEVSLARAATLFWGDSCIDFEFVMVALEKWREDSSRFAPPVGLDNIAAIRFNRRAERKRIPMPFARMMHGGRKFDCKDPRDRVYALLGMRSIGTWTGLWFACSGFWVQ